MNAMTRLIATQANSPNYWGKRGAGCLVFAQNTGRFLFPLRSAKVDMPNTWGTWGGAIDKGENPAIAVRRELREEAGYHGDSTLLPLMVNHDMDKGVVYHNYLAIVPEEFQPKLNWETAKAVWIELDQAPQPMHPGLEALLEDSQSMRTIQGILKRREAA